MDPRRSGRNQARAVEVGIRPVPSRMRAEKWVHTRAEEKLPCDPDKFCHDQRLSGLCRTRRSCASITEYYYYCTLLAETPRANILRKCWSPLRRLGLWIWCKIFVFRQKCDSHIRVPIPTFVSLFVVALVLPTTRYIPSLCLPS